MAQSAFSGYVVFTPGRVFINSSLGCPARCVYCYIADYGYGGRPRIAPFSGSELREHLQENRQFCAGPRGDILSFGCFTESLCKPFITKTLEFIRAVAPLGNPIQIATKWSVPDYIVQTVGETTTYEGQLNVFASVITLQWWNEIEPGTINPLERVETLARFRDHGHNVYLYIKPAIPGVTDNEIPKFRDLMLQYDLDVCVIGALFTNPRITDSINGELRNISGHLNPLGTGRESMMFPVPGPVDLRMGYPLDTLNEMLDGLTEHTEIRAFVNSVEATRFKLGTLNTT